MFIQKHSFINIFYKSERTDGILAFLHILQLLKDRKCELANWKASTIDANQIKEDKVSHIHIKIVSKLFPVISRNKSQESTVLWIRKLETKPYFLSDEMAIKFIGF